MSIEIDGLTFKTEGVHKPNVKELKQMYAKFNFLYFDNKLPKDLPIYVDSLVGALGMACSSGVKYVDDKYIKYPNKRKVSEQCDFDKFENIPFDAPYGQTLSITIDSELPFTEYIMYNTLIHEMIHIKDFSEQVFCSHTGHGGQWKDKAEEINEKSGHKWKINWCASPEEMKILYSNKVDLMVDISKWKDRCYIYLYKSDKSEGESGYCAMAHAKDVIQSHSYFMDDFSYILKPNRIENLPKFLFARLREFGYYVPLSNDELNIILENCTLVRGYYGFKPTPIDDPVFDGNKPDFIHIDEDLTSALGPVSPIRGNIGRLFGIDIPIDAMIKLGEPREIEGSVFKDYKDLKTRKVTDLTDIEDYVLVFDAESYSYLLLKIADPKDTEENSDEEKDTKELVGENNVVSKEVLDRQYNFGYFIYNILETHMLKSFADRSYGPYIRGEIMKNLRKSGKISERFRESSNIPGNRKESKLAEEIEAVKSMTDDMTSVGDGPKKQSIPQAHKTEDGRYIITEPIMMM